MIDRSRHLYHPVDVEEADERCHARGWCKQVVLGRKAGNATPELAS